MGGPGGYLTNFRQPWWNQTVIHTPMFDGSIWFNPTPLFRHEQMEQQNETKMVKSNNLINPKLPRSQRWNHLWKPALKKVGFFPEDFTHFTGCQASSSSCSFSMHQGLRRFHWLAVRCPSCHVRKEGSRRVEPPTGPPAAWHRRRKPKEVNSLKIQRWYTWNIKIKWLQIVSIKAHLTHSVREQKIWISQTVLDGTGIGKIRQTSLTFYPGLSTVSPKWAPRWTAGESGVRGLGEVTLKMKLLWQTLARPEMVWQNKRGQKKRYT